MDLDQVDAIQRIAHAALPEQFDFMAEKLALCPEGCRKLVRGGKMVGYGLAHPGRLGHPPPLNATLRPLPAGPDCLHMHDVAILAEGRGENAAERYVRHLRALAETLGIGALACVSVYGTGRLWERYGFRPAPSGASLASYGGGAVYMTAILGVHPAWRIRPARRADAEGASEAVRRSITELCIADHGNDADILRRWLANKTTDQVERWIEGNPHGTFVAEGQDGTILSLGAILPSGEIVLNYVAPNGRFQGISKAMIGALETRARERGHAFCTLTSTQTAHRFYRQLGYADSGERIISPLGMPGRPMRREL